MFQKFIIHLLLLFILSLSVSAQRQFDYTRLKSNYAKEIEHQKQKEQLKHFINEVYTEGVLNFSEEKIIDLLNKVDLTLYRDSLVFKILNSLFNNKATYSNKLKLAISQTVYTLYPTSFEEQVFSLYSETNDKNVFSTCAIYLNNINRLNSKEIIDLFKNKFNPNISDSYFLYLKDYLFKHDSTIKSEIRPNLESLFTADFMKGFPIIFTLIRNDRNLSGITIIRKPNGKFLRESDTSYFYVKQLACSVSNLPSFIPNGNTPQGIYSIVGWYISPTESIGPSPIVLTRSPKEVTPEIFYHQKNISKSWSKKDYENLLPADWKLYRPIWESFYARRKLIIMHGSTDDLTDYKNLPYYPLTPTKGCLSTIEQWDATSGKCIYSDQVKLINAYLSLEKKKGFLVVIEIDDGKTPVTLEEIKKYLK